MRRLTLVIILVILSLTVPAMAGKGSPATEQQGEETGRALQAGPGGPNYGKQTPTPVPTSIPTTTTKPGTVYRVYLPFISVGESVSPESVSPIFRIQPK